MHPSCNKVDRRPQRSSWRTARCRTGLCYAVERRWRQLAEQSCNLDNGISTTSATCLLLYVLVGTSCKHKQLRGLGLRGMWPGTLINYRIADGGSGRDDCSAHKVCMH